MNSVFQDEEPDAYETMALATQLAYISSGIRHGAVPCAEDLLKRLRKLPGIDPAIHDAMKVAVDQMTQVGEMLRDLALKKAREAAENEISEITGVSASLPDDDQTDESTTPAPVPAPAAAPATNTPRPRRQTKHRGDKG